MTHAAPLLALLLVGCATFPGPPPRPHCPVSPVATSALPRELSLRAQMTFHFDDRTVQLETIVRHTGDDLVVVGLAHHGRSLFTLVQRNRELSLEAAQPGGSHILAFWVVDALHRAFWIQSPADTGDGRSTDGETRWEWHGEQVRETSAGTSRQRSFARGAGGRRGREDVTIEYAAAKPGDVPADRMRAEIHNPWCGYEAVVVARQERPGSGATRPAAEHGGAER